MIFILLVIIIMAYPNSKVELRKPVAAHYDAIMTISTFGGYYHMMKKAVNKMKIKEGETILDMGAGTGKVACFMLEKFRDVKVIGLDISNEMIENFRRNCKGRNAEIIKARIDEPFDLGIKFDKVFISFVLHGFPQFAREEIIKNAYNCLKNQGEFFILDYNEFSFSNAPFFVKALFKAIECPYAFDFIERDWKKILHEYGFKNFDEKLFFKGYIRLLKAVKNESL